MSMQRFIAVAIAAGCGLLPACAHQLHILTAIMWHKVTLFGYALEGGNYGVCNPPKPSQTHRSNPKEVRTKYHE